MGSSSLASLAASSSADPYLWSALAAIAAGLAAGQAVRALVPTVWGRAGFERKRSARGARAIALLALALLAAAALLVLADKTSLAAALPSGLVPWACVLFGLGLVAGFRPFAAGLPLLAVAVCLVFSLGLCLEGWLPVRPSNDGGFEVARLLPYQTGPSGFRGQLELPERDSVPVAQDLSLSTNALKLRVETLAFAGPLRLLSSLAFPRGASAGYSPTLRLYRVVGAASADGSSSLDFSRPPRASWLDLFLGLGSRDSRTALFGLASRRSLASPPAALVALESVSFALSADASTLALRSGR
jgi:hypothetical protein